MKLYILNGPNLNLLGIREPEIYGRVTYDELVKKIREKCEFLGISCNIYQSNHEGDLVDWIQQAYREGADGVILNAGGYTHTSVAIPDAIRATLLPTVEVHISDVDAREDFRRVNFLRPVCAHSIAGHGVDGYFEAIDWFCEEKR